MPLQNRVDPWGRLVATEHRGTMLGNRGGRFHRPDKTLGPRRWASPHWICCELHYKDTHHDAMGHGYTSLFFLDEVTALAAGHRPCFFCRRADAKNFLTGQAVPEFDAQLHIERLAPKIETEVNAVPEGAMVEHGGEAYARHAGRFLLWSFAGYIKAVHFNPAMPAKLLTPPTITAILVNGFQPRWHETAQQWDD